MNIKFKSLAALAVIFFSVSNASAAPWVNKSMLSNAPNTLNVNTCDYRLARNTGSYYGSTYFASSDRFLFKKNTYSSGTYGTGYSYVFEVPLSQLSVIANTTTLGVSKASEFVNKAYLNAKAYSMTCELDFTYHTLRGRSYSLACFNNAAGSDAAFTDILPLNASLIVLQEKCD